MILVYVIGVLAILGLSGCQLEPSRPLVKTPNGDIQGTYSTSHEGKKFSQFVGVPYAQPPIKELRFLEPQPIQKWGGIWNANFTSVCIQVTMHPGVEDGKIVGDEDCLHLSIFVPGDDFDTKNNLDVVVHIHGGAFNFGAGNFYAGPKYLMDINIIFITINYRLGPLGFLSTEDDVVPGNNGMKDQTAALKWIKNNIKYFGGNPDSITITGLSAGGSSVHFHYLSSLSEGLFKGGISTSGNALCPWALQEHPLKKAKKLGVSLGCLQDSTKDLVECLRTRPARQIAEGVRMFRSWLINPFSPFGVVVEKHGKHPFLSDHPYNLLLKGQVQDVPWITSVTSEEGLFPAIEIFAQDRYLVELESRWEELAPHLLDYAHTVSESNLNLTSKKIKEYYLKDKPISKESFLELVQMVGDRHFVVSAEQSAMLQAKATKSSVYFYYFSYHSKEIPTLAVHMSTVKERYGVCHGDDLMYVLSTPNEPTVKMTENDEKVKNIFLNMWSSFISSSKPMVLVNDNDVEWLSVSKKKNDPLQYLHIKSPSSVFMSTSDEMGHSRFWNSIPFEENHNILNEIKDEL